MDINQIYFLTEVTTDTRYSIKDKLFTIEIYLDLSKRIDKMCMTLNSLTCKVVSS